VARQLLDDLLVDPVQRRAGLDRLDGGDLRLQHRLVQAPLRGRERAPIGNVRVTSAV
jgi:hypothetical protein